MYPRRPLLLLSALASVKAQSVTLLNLTAADVPTLSSTCLSVLNQAVACDPSFVDTVKTGLNSLWWYTDDWLSTVCTTTCQSGLTAWLRRISGACGTQRIIGTDGTQGLPAQYAEYYVELWSEACVKASSGSFCNAEARNLAGIDPVDQQVTGTQASSYICSSCFLSLIATRLEMPLASNTNQYSQWSTLTSACGATGISLTSPASTAWVLPPSTTTTTASATPTCSGTTYAIKSGDTCQSISKSQGIDTVQLLVANSLSSFCYDFPTSGNLCIPSSLKCTVYTVQASDTCFTLADAAGGDTTWTQILSWNPELGFDCNNIGQYVGYQVCLTVPGGRLNPVSTTDPVSVISSTTTDTYMWTPFSAYSTPIVTANTSSTASGIPVATIAPIANDTRQDCFHYEQPPILTNLTAGTSSSSCSAAALAFNVTTDDLIAWNPSLNSSTTADCTLDNDYRYCVLLYETPENATDYCDQWALPAPGFTCTEFANSYGVEVDQFIQWNPSVGSGCAKFSGSLSYCVSVYGFRQSGAISTCNLWAIANDTQWVDQPCQILETQFGLSHARFVAWNPAVQSNCTGIYPGYEYCVSIPNYRPTYTTPSTSVRATAAVNGPVGNHTVALSVTTTSSTGGSTGSVKASGKRSVVTATSSL